MQCNGITLKGIRCKKIIKKLNNTIDGKIYCQVHYPKIIQTKINQIDQINQDNYIKIPDYILKAIPIDILNDVKYLPIDDLERIFLPDNFILFECQCCYCECFAKDKIKCSEGHEFCKDCLTSYVTDRITSGDYKLHCMANSECQGFYCHKALSILLDKKIYQTYSNKEFQEVITLANLDNLYTCPKCCLYSLVIDQQYLKYMEKFECKNPDCKSITCLKCRNQYHGIISCDYIKRDQSIRKTIEEILTKNRIRSCPKCHKEFIRIDGCNKMICSCQEKSCYICGKKIDNYSHFYDNNNIIDGKCPLYTNEDYIERISFENSLNEIYKLYENDNTKLREEVYPILMELEKKYKQLINYKFSKIIK